MPLAQTEALSPHTTAQAGSIGQSHDVEESLRQARASSPQQAGHGALPPGELRRIALDISSAPNAIAWKPWTHLEDGLRETVAYLKGI